jgi:pimeloyl-ACP methyl ester carboxylesterase
MNTRPEEIEIEIPYLRLAARAWGPETGLPVLALHGWLDNAASFDRLAPLLPELRLIALDLPGHGLSDHRPAGVHYHFIDFVPDVIAATEKLGWTRFALLGHSLGAGIASFAAAVIPQRISHLALIEGLGPLSGKAGEGPAVLAKSMRQMAALSGKGLTVYPSLEDAIKARFEAGDLSWQAAASLAVRGSQSVSGGISWRSDPQLTLTSPIYLTEEQVLAFIDRIKAPTLLIVGESGYLSKREFMAERYARLRQLEITVLPGGHHLHLEDPAPTARVLAQFFNS